jgi:glycosyltransferase involved in cell wall biosynthesis
MGEHTLRKQVYLSLLSRRLLEGARAVHCTAQGEADQSSKHFPKGRAVVAPLLVDMTPFRSLPGAELARSQFEALRRPGLKVLCVSRLHEVKGLDRVLRAAAGLKGADQAVELVFAGPADPASYADVLRSQASALGLRENMHLLGMVSGASKTSLYQAADLYIQPSIHENFGLSLVESLAAGTPIITSKGVNIWPELQSSGGAVIIEEPPSRDEGELRLAMSSLATDVSRRERMGAAGRRWALELLDQKRILNAYEAMYRGEAVGDPSRTSAPASVSA